MMDSFILYAHNNMKWLSRYFYKKSIDDDLRLAGMKYRGDEYTSLSISVAILVSLLSMSLAAFSRYWLPLSILVFAASYVATIGYPLRKARAIAREIDREIPGQLREIAIELNSGMGFEEIMEKHSKGEGRMPREFKRAMQETRQGSSMQKALSNIGMRTKSRRLSKAMNLLIAAYDSSSGNAGESIRKLANDFSRQERTLLKEYHSKLAVYSLIFISFSAVVPAMFQAFVILGSNFLDMQIGPRQALLVPVLVFPVVNITLIAFVLGRRP